MSRDRSRGLTPVILGLVLSSIGCSAARQAPVPPAPEALTTAELTAAIPSQVKDRAAWAQAVLDALRANELPGYPSLRDTACAVLAIIGQESGFQEDPVVPGLAR